MPCAKVHDQAHAGHDCVGLANGCKPRVAVPVQPVRLQAAAQLHIHVVVANRAALVQVRPLAANLAPARVVVFRVPPHAFLTGGGDGIAQVVLHRAAGQDIPAQPPVVHHPAHAVKHFAVHAHLWQPRAVAGPPVNQGHRFHVQAIVAGDLRHRHRQKRAQAAVVLLAFPFADAAILHAIAGDAVHPLGGLLPLGVVFGRGFVLLCLCLFQRVQHGRGQGWRVRFQLGEYFQPPRLLGDLEQVGNVALLRQRNAALRQVEQFYALASGQQQSRHLAPVIGARFVDVGQDDHVRAP